VHNHPSGDATPSEEDEFRTRELEIAGLLLGVTVLDHVVVGGNEYQSIRATNRMVLPLENADELTEEQVEARVQEVLGVHFRQARANTEKTKRQKRTDDSGAGKAGAE
jgi:hypothetical protein